MKLLFLGRTRDETEDGILCSNGIIFHETRDNGLNTRKHGRGFFHGTRRLRSGGIEHEEKGSLGVGDLVLIHDSVLSYSEWVMKLLKFGYEKQSRPARQGNEDNLKKHIQECACSPNKRKMQRIQGNRDYQPHGENMVKNAPYCTEGNQNIDCFQYKVFGIIG